MNPDFHFFTLPTTANQLQDVVVSKDKLYSSGKNGSKQKTSICAPLSFLNSNLAGTTFVLLNTIIESGGNNRARFENLSSLMIPSSKMRILDESLSGKGYLAILLSGSVYE